MRYWSDSKSQTEAVFKKTLLPQFTRRTGKEGQDSGLDFRLDFGLDLDWTWTGLGLDLDWTWTGLGLDFRLDLLSEVDI